MVSSLSQRTKSTGAGVGNSPEIKRFLQLLIDFLLPVVSLKWDNIKYDSKNFHFPNPFEAKSFVQAQHPGPKPHGFSFGFIQFGTGTKFTNINTTKELSYETFGYPNPNPNPTNLRWEYRA